MKLLRSTVGMSLLFIKLWGKKKEICVSIAVAPNTSEITATVCDKCLVKTEEALSLYKIQLTLEQHGS